MTGPSMVRLGCALVDVQSGFASGEDLPSGTFQLRMNNVTPDGRLDLSRRRRVSLAPGGGEASLLSAGDVAFNATNSREQVGKSAYFPGADEDVAFSNHFLRLRPDAERLDGKYLARWLHLQFTRGVFQSMCRKWVNQATVTRESLVNLEIPLPPLAEQRRISAILDHVEGLWKKRKEAIARLNELDRAVFLESFGDPVSNPKGLPTRPIADVGTVVTGNTPSRMRPEYYGDAIEWLKSDNLNSPEYFATPAEERLSEEGKLLGRVVPPLSILVTCIAGSPDCIGNAAIVDREVAFNQQINALVPRVGDAHFLYAQFRFGKRVVQVASTNAMKGMVNKTRFEQIHLLFPSEGQQREYGRIALHIEAIRRRHNCHLKKLEALARSLEDRAFHGEL